MRMLLSTVVLVLFAITASGGEHVAVVAIEGNHLAEIGDVFKKCKYEVEKSSKVNSGKEASRELGQKLNGDRVTKVAYFASGWTFILDPELVLFSRCLLAQGCAEIHYGHRGPLLRRFGHS